jgi:hypothetical protein
MLDKHYTDFGVKNSRFYVDYRPCSRPVDNLRLESERYARELSATGQHNILGLSTGLDSQVVLHSFLSQGLPLESAFLYFPTFNEVEFKQLQLLEKKYNFKATVIDMDPIAIQDSIMEESRAIDIPPNQIIHKRFLDQLPKDANFIQGIEGPNIISKSTDVSNIHYLFESFNSFEKSRVRACLELDRTGQYISWERHSEIMLSILDDNIFKGYLFSTNYIINNTLVYPNETEKPRLIDRWDLYIKPLMYGLYWGNDLFYFAKYGGPEGIDYIMNGPKHSYAEKMLAVPFNHLVSHLKTGTSTKRFYETAFP